MPNLMLIPSCNTLPASGPLRSPFPSPPQVPSAPTVAGVVLGNTPSGPEDFWTPALELPPGSAYVEEYGAVSPVPGHDGTDCFKWDNTLWGSAGHFKVGGWERGEGGTGAQG